MKEYVYKKSRPYHFEMSDEYIREEIIRFVESIINNGKVLSINDVWQLNSMVALEMARFQLSKGQMLLKSYKEFIQAIANQAKSHGLEHIFEDTQIHNDFYSAINEEYTK